MPTLAPRTTFDVAIENPVERPSPLKAVAGLVDAGLQVAGAVAKGGDPNLEAGLIAGLEQAAQLREQGKEAEALSLERRVKTNYSVAGGDLNSGQTKELIRSYTGQAPETVGFTPDEMLAQAIMDPTTEQGKAYQRASLAARGMKPDASTEETHDLAMSLMIKEEANAALIEEAQFEWSASGREAILDRVTTFGNLQLGALANVAESGGTVTLEDIQAVGAQFAGLKAQVMGSRPSNVPADEWATITAALDAKQEQIKYLETLAGPANLDARASAQLIRAIQETPGVTDINKNIYTRIVQADPGLFLDRNILDATTANQDLSTITKYSQERNGPMDEGSVRDASVWDESVMFDESGNAFSPEEGLKYAQTASTLMTTIPTDALNRNPELRNEWGRAATRQLSALQGLSEQGRYVSAPELTKMFGRKWQADMRTLAAVDPALHRAVAGRAAQVLERQRSIVSQKFSVVAEGSVYEFNTQTGGFRLTRESAMRGMTQPDFNMMDEMVDRYYDGSWQALMDDNGKAIYNSGFSPAIAAWARYTGPTGPIPKDLKSLGDSLAMLNQTTNALFEGGPQQPTQTTTAFTGNPKMLQMVDSTEGGGSYKTLFGFAERNSDSEFYGTDITRMTIGDLKAFTSKEGKYGHWVAGQTKAGAFATPLGRYQFVGTTMSAIAKDMGLGDDVLFTPAVQDAMFHHHVTKGLNARPQGEWAGWLRGQWVGFNKKVDGEYVYSDQDLVNAGAEMLGMAPPAVAYETGRGDVATTLAPFTTASPPGRSIVADVETEVVTQDVELDDAETQTDIEQGSASRAAVGEQQARMIQVIMKRFNVSEEEAIEIIEEMNS